MTLNTKITLPDSLFLQVIDGETILLDTETELYFSLNEVGTVIWDFLADADTLADVHTKMLEHYDVESMQLEKDIVAFVTALEEKGLVSVKR